MPEDELGEVNAGNVAFLGLGCDGGYSVSVVDSPPAARTISVRLKCPSGRFFIGAGEEVTPDELEPECVCGGQFVTMPAGAYSIMSCRDDAQISIYFERLGTSIGDTHNSFTDLLRLVDRRQVLTFLTDPHVSPSVPGQVRFEPSQERTADESQ